jgi:antitoxin MazE
MERAIIKIGNSQGVIIPKEILSKFGKSRKVEIQFRDGGMFIVPAHDRPRKGWAKAFAEATKAGEVSEDFFEDTENEFDREEWTW